MSGAMISDATQVVQFTVKPVASAPKSNINETQSGKVQKTMDQARPGAPVSSLHDSHMRSVWLYHTARPRVRCTPSIPPTHPVLMFFPYKPDA